MLAGKGKGKIHGRHAFPDSALPAHDHQLMLDAGHASLHLLHLVGNLSDDLGVVGIAKPAENSLQVFFISHEASALIHKERYRSTAVLSQSNGSNLALCHYSGTQTQTV